jgi:hypothetical protein
MAKLVGFAEEQRVRTNSEAAWGEGLKGLRTGRGERRGVLDGERPGEAGESYEAQREEELLLRQETASLAIRQPPHLNAQAQHTQRENTRRPRMRARGAWLIQIDPGWWLGGGEER